MLEVNRCICTWKKDKYRVVKGLVVVSSAGRITIPPYLEPIIEMEVVES